MAKTDGNPKPKATGKPRTRSQVPAAKQRVGWAAGDLAGLRAFTAGFMPAPSQMVGGTGGDDQYTIYRRMRQDPTIALARAVAYAPMSRAAWSVEADGGVPDEMRIALEGWVLALRPALLANMLRAMDYGWQAFERIVKRTATAWRIAMLKPLYHDITDIRTDKQTGEFRGVKQGDVLLEPEECFLFSYDSEAGDLYGRSRNENVRGVWDLDMQLFGFQASYNRRVAGVIPIIRYPEGEGVDENGMRVNQFDVAVVAEGRLGGSRGICVPNTIAKWGEAYIRGGGDPAKVRAWDFEFLESSVQHGSAFVEQHRHLDSLKLRGWLVPERAAIEGQYGTKAEASSHGDMAINVAEDALGEFIRQINKQLVDDLVRWNFGERFVGMLRLMAAPLADDARDFYRALMMKLLDATTLDIFQPLTDMQTIALRSGLPSPREATGTGEPPVAEVAVT